MIIPAQIGDKLLGKYNDHENLSFIIKKKKKRFLKFNHIGSYIKCMNSKTCLNLGLRQNSLLEKTV